MSKSVAIFVGLLIAVLAEYLALMLAGAGHGWGAPLRYSLLLFVAYPIALARISNSTRASVAVDAAMFVVGAGASFRLFQNIRETEAEYFWKLVDAGLPIVILWLAIWFGWQALTVANALRGAFGSSPSPDPSETSR